MTADEFEVILEERVLSMKGTLANKSKEYAFNGDRLYNFRQGGRILGITPEEALTGMMNKHIVSVLDLVDGNLSRTESVINEKIGDLINYLVLLEALLMEDIAKEQL